MRLLLFSDVHANLEALQAVIAAAGPVDRCLFLGDVVDYGPSPAECFRLWRELAWAAVKGNHDAAVAEGFDCGWYGGISGDIRRFQAQQLDQPALAFLAGLPETCSLQIAGARFFLVHARPRQPLEGYLLPSLAEDELAAELAGVEADFVLLGHAHHQYWRQLGGMTVINPGSVGQPRDGDPRAAYALWEDGAVSLHRVEYDLAGTCRRLAAAPIREGDQEVLCAILQAGG